MASAGRGRGGGRGRGRARPVVDGRPVDWDMNDKSSDPQTFIFGHFPDIELPELDPPTDRELRMIDNYQALRKRLHNDLRAHGFPIEPVASISESQTHTSAKKDPFKAFESYSQSKYQKRAQEGRYVLKVKWDPKRYNLECFPKSLRRVIDPSYDATSGTTATTRGAQDGRPTKRRRVVDDDDEDEEDGKKGENEEVDRDVEEGDEPDPDETFSDDDDEMAGDYGNNYFDNGEDEDDGGGGGSDGDGGGGDYD